MKQCKNCKQTIDEKDKVCPNCGKKQIDINKIEKKTKRVLFISIVLELITIILIMIAIGANAIRIKNKPTNLFIMSPEAIEHNGSFESYFGKDVTPIETKALLSEIRANNFKTDMDDEKTIIGVCFISKNTTTNQDLGIYSIDVSNTNSETFAKLNFSKDIDEIIKLLDARTSYTINTPNSEIWQRDKKGNTGFEKKNVQTGSTGAYYSNGYIRLVYIIDNNLKTDSTDTNSNSISNITTTNTTVNNISNNSNLQQKQASSRFVSIDALDTQEAQAQNSKFDSYFGTDVTPYEVKDLLSEIRTNNLNAIRNKNAAIIGVCFISRNGTTNPTYGIYSMNNSNDYRDSSAFFDNLYFCPTVEEITKSINYFKRYTVNIPNLIAWQDDVNGKTGFETADNPMGQSITGNSGGYYSSGYIRLIYFIEND